MVEKIYFHDRLLASTILKLIPRTITPNMVTVTRFMLTPVVLFFLLQEKYTVALLLFFITAFTDAIDGSMARTRNQITEWGIVYDPVADKLLIGSVMLIFVMRFLNIYLALTVVGLEILFLIGGYFKKRKGDVTAANWWGKNKMILQVFGVVSMLCGVIFQNALFMRGAEALFIGAIACALINFVKVGARF